MMLSTEGIPVGWRCTQIRHSMPCQCLLSAFLLQSLTRYLLKPSLESPVTFETSLSCESSSQSSLVFVYRTEVFVYHSERLYRLFAQERARKKQIQLCTSLLRHESGAQVFARQYCSRSYTACSPASNEIDSWCSKQPVFLHVSLSRS